MINTREENKHGLVEGILFQLILYRVFISSRFSVLFSFVLYEKEMVPKSSTRGVVVGCRIVISTCISFPIYFYVFFSSTSRVEFFGWFVKMYEQLTWLEHLKINAVFINIATATSNSSIIMKMLCIMWLLNPFFQFKLKFTIFHF